MKKEEKSFWNKIKGNVRKVCAAAYTVLLLFCNSSMVLAGSTTGVPEIDKSMSVIKSIFLGLISLIGILITIKGIADTAQAYQQQDSHGMYDGMKGIGAGAIMIFIGPVLSVIGIV